MDAEIVEAKSIKVGDLIFDAPHTYKVTKIESVSGYVQITVDHRPSQPWYSPHRRPGERIVRIKQKEAIK